MPSLAKLQANTATAAIDFGDGDVLHVTYYPARITGAMMSAYTAIAPSAAENAPSAAENAPSAAENAPSAAENAQASDERALAAVASVLSVSENLRTLVQSWDLTDTDAETGEEVAVPLTTEGIGTLGIMLQWTIFNGILADLGQGEAGARQAAAGKDAPSVSGKA